jgi:flagellin
MTAQIEGMGVAKRNTLDAVSMLQSAEGSLSSQVEQLNKIRELAVRAANGSLTDSDRQKLNKEAQGLFDEIDTIASSANFNGNLLLSNKDAETRFPTITPGNGYIHFFNNNFTELGFDPTTRISATEVILDISKFDHEDIGKSFFTNMDEHISNTDMSNVHTYPTQYYEVHPTGKLDSSGNYEFKLVNVTEKEQAVFQVGSNRGQTREVIFPRTDTMTLGLIDFNSVDGMDRISLLTGADAEKTISRLDSALSILNRERAEMGGYQNRLSKTIDNLNSSIANTSSSRSRIEDADFAEETANMTKNQILHQAGVAMLQQANSLPESVLALLK